MQATCREVMFCWGCGCYCLVSPVLREKFGSPYLGKAQQPQERRYPFLPVSAVFSCVQLPVFGIFIVRQVLMNAIAHGGCTDTVSLQGKHIPASLSGTFLQTLPDLVTPLKGHSLPPRSCPPTRSAPSERFGY